MGTDVEKSRTVSPDPPGRDIERGRPTLRRWVTLPATLGFAAGFLGPAILNPEANQGPLFGIFITGPGGAALGLALGLAVRWLPISAAREWQLLWGASAALTVWTLIMSLPGPRLLGYVIDAELRSCSPPSQSLEQAMSFWERRLAGTDARPGWQADARASIAADRGMVLELSPLRTVGIYEDRKPWSKGQFEVRSRHGNNAPRRYYASDADGSCDAYPPGKKGEYYVASRLSAAHHGRREWPPTSDIPTFLGLHTVVPVPDEYRRLVNDRMDR